MKEFVKKILKAVLVFILSTIIIYLALTLKLFYKKCNDNQIILFSKDYSDDLSFLDKEKVKELGDTIGLYEELLEISREESQYKEDGKEHTIDDGHKDHSLGDIYDPLGFSVWSHIQTEVCDITTRYISISILSGVAIVVAYVIITCKKMNNILKFAIGYFGVMLIIPPIYMYTWTYRFWDIFHTYSNMPKYFYIGYTAIFVLMYVINYRIGIKMSKELNQAINDKKEESKHMN